MLIVANKLVDKTSPQANVYYILNQILLTRR